MNKKIITLLCFVLLSVIRTVSAQNYIISTVAGNGVAGSMGDGKLAIDGSINTPWGLAVDKKGNIYMVDINSSTVEKVDTNGILSTFAGPGSCFTCPNAGDGGLAKAARLNSPTSVAVDTFGNVYIADWGDLRIRKVDKDGIITTVAGKGTYGFSGDGGPADSAQMTEPYGVAVDDSGNVFFADAFNNRIRKVNTNGIITTIAGNGGQGYSGNNGPAINATLNTPVGVYADKLGNIFIADGNNSVIRKVDNNGIITTVAGTGGRAYSGDGGPATSAQINHPWEVAVDDSGNIYIPDGSQRIRKVYTNGIIQTIAGTGATGFGGDGGPATSATMNQPFGIAVDHNGNIFFADEINERIRKLSPCSSALTFTSSSPHVCKGQSININLNAVNSYNWSPALGLNTTKGYRVIASPTATTTYSITGTSCAANGTLVVTVDTFPVVKVTPASKTVCEGQNIQLTASGGLTYKWSPAKGLSQLTGSSVMANPGFSTTYTVVGSNGYCATKDSIALTIGNSFRPGSIKFSVDSVCPGTPEKITISGSLGSLQLQASDSLGHFNNIAGATGSTYSFNATNTTYYRILATNSNCTDTSVEYKLDILPAPSVSFIFAIKGQQVYFASTPEGGVTGYAWDFGDGEMSNDSNPVHTYATGKVYNVCLTVNNHSNCSFTTCTPVTVKADGIENIIPQANWNIYPTPTDGQLTLEINNSLAENNNITITDMLGRVVYNQVITGHKSLINLSGLPSATYFIHLNKGNVSEVRKVIKD